MLQSQSNATGRTSALEYLTGDISALQAPARIAL